MHLEITSELREDFSNVFEIDIRTMIGDGDEYERVINRFEEEADALKYLEVVNFIGENDEVPRDVLTKQAVERYGSEVAEWVQEWPHDYNGDMFYSPYTVTVSYFDASSRKFLVRVEDPVGDYIK